MKASETDKPITNASTQAIGAKEAHTKGNIIREIKGGGNG